MPDQGERPADEAGSSGHFHATVTLQMDAFDLIHTVWITFFDGWNETSRLVSSASYSLHQVPSSIAEALQCLVDEYKPLRLL